MDDITVLKEAIYTENTVFSFSFLSYHYDLNDLYQVSDMKSSRLIGLAKICPERPGVGFVNHKKTVSLVPRLTWGKGHNNIDTILSEKLEGKKKKRVKHI